MKLKEFKEYIDKCVESAEDCDPEIYIYFKKSYYTIRSISQNYVIPDVHIEIGTKLDHF